MQAFDTYIAELQNTYAAGKATEHSYRPFLQAFLGSLLSNNFTITNEPKRIKCGAPDYIIEKKNIPVGYIEAKDIGRLGSLNKIEKDQLERYTDSLDNLIYTDYLTFQFYRKKELVATVQLARIENGKIVADQDGLEHFLSLFANFLDYQTQTIRHAKTLAEMMAKKAKLLKEVFANILKEDRTSSLYRQYQAFEQVLIHNISANDFADIYAETLAYGLFTARLHDPTMDTFSRQEAYELIPKSNPFLRELFTYVATDLDDRAKWIVDDLCEVFLATDVKKMLEAFNRGSGRTDPFIHFYETFLALYDPKRRQRRGVWYTPESVVQFIVRAVDDVLKTHFNLPQGLADTSKTSIKVPEKTADKRIKSGYVDVEKEVHRVQVLDVATGTGTFLAEVISKIHEKYKNQQGMWSSYVEEHLIPRVNGFELLMASYAMCHMKLDLLLSETGYKPKTNPPRLNVYLTNSLEKAHDEMDKLPLIEWFSRESNEASRIKKQSPIMVAIGNPPYSGISSNMGDDLIVDIDDYKYVDGIHFGERKHWLHDDYVKFIRFGEHFIEKNGEGVLGYITNHSYLDNPTFKGMRWHLLKTFDVIYILDLHGNSNKKEACPDGSKDVNVFDIKQGVSIIIGVKTFNADSEKLADVYHVDVWGKRNDKYQFLEQATLESINWQKLDCQEPFYFFIPTNTEHAAEYQKGFGVNELFPVNVTGIVTARDGLVIDFTKKELKQKIKKFADPTQTDDEVRAALYPNKKAGKYPPGDSRGWKLGEARKAIADNDHNKVICDISYRPFDTRSIYYTPAMVDWGREKVMKHFMSGPNIGLVTARSNKSGRVDHFFVSKKMTEAKTGESTTQSAQFPLYLYDETDGQKRPNLDPDIWAELQKAAPAADDPQAVFDYIYATLHSPAYREKYAEFLKSDFPRIPYPTSNRQFTELAELGAYLRKLHLMEHPDCSNIQTSYPEDGSHTVEKPTFEDGKVYINPDQYFDNVPEVAWNFYIGGYQPAQKWLKDRKGRELTLDDITHYQRIITTLAKTHEVMQQIDEVGE